jgi:hypothetical protein
MKTIAQTAYETIDVELSEGVVHQATNWCANNENSVISIESKGLYTHVVFTDGSAINFDDYSVSVAG